MKLTLNRSGKFPCHWLSTDNMCGTIHTTEPIYSYNCIIETADILDKRGFVMDQLDVNNYFQKRYTQDKRGRQTKHAAVSCEQIAINAVNEIKHMLESHFLKNSGISVIYRLAVTISFGPGDASITAEWRPESDKQIANVKKLLVRHPIPDHWLPEKPIVKHSLRKRTIL